MSDPGRRRWTRLLPRRDVVGWTSLWFAIAALVVLPYVHSYRHLSPLDEMVRLDYVVKLQHGHLVRGGERIGPVAMRAQVCRGSDLDRYQAPKCGQKMVARKFPIGGFSTAFRDPPVYYVVTAAGATVVDALPGVDDVVTAARSVGVLWLGAGLALTFLLARRLGADSWAAAGATLVLGSTPAVAHASATITTDSPSLLVGAVLCLVAVSVVRGRAAWWWLAPAAAAATSVKATGLSVAGLVVVFLLLYLARSPRPATMTDEEPTGELSQCPTQDPDLPVPLARRAVWLAIAAVVVPAVGVLGAWAVVNAFTNLPAVDDPVMTSLYRVDSIGWTELVSNLLPLLSPVQQGYMPPYLVNPTLGNLMALVNLVCVAGVAILAWTGARGAVSTRLGVATLVAMLAAGVGYTLLIFFGSHTYIAIPARYGLSLLPAVAAGLAVVASRRRFGGYVLTGLGAVTLVALLAQTL